MLLYFKRILYMLSEIKMFHVKHFLKLNDSKGFREFVSGYNLTPYFFILLKSSFLIKKFADDIAINKQSLLEIKVTIKNSHHFTVLRCGG